MYKKNKIYALLFYFLSVHHLHLYVLSKLNPKKEICLQTFSGHESAMSEMFSRTHRTKIENEQITQKELKKILCIFDTTYAIR